MNILRLLLLPLACALAPLAAEPRVLAVPNAGFEDGAAGWDLSAADGTARVLAEAARSGKAGLRIESETDDRRAYALGPRVPVEPGVGYRLSWQGRVRVGGGTNVFLRLFDAEGRELAREEGRVNSTAKRDWAPGWLEVIPPVGAVAMDILIQRPSWRPFPYQIDLDDFALEATPLVAAAPWPGTYKLRPDETDRLTAADVAGPDGLVYPDFTYAGVPGGIPAVPVALRLADLGARPGQDISRLLEEAAERVAAKGGGAIELAEGTFYLDQPVVILGDGVVIRGAGRDRTRLVFRYRVPPGELDFFRLKPGQELGANGLITVHAHPRQLVSLELRAAGKSLGRREGEFRLSVEASDALRQLGAGAHTFTAVAAYRGGERVERTITLRLVDGSRGAAMPWTHRLGGINFMGRGTTTARRPLLADGRRGERVVELGEGHGYAVGDRITVIAPATERFRRLLEHHMSWHTLAQGLFEVVAVEGGRVTLSQPLRTDFLREDGAFAQKMALISGCGVEGVGYEQASSIERTPGMKDADYKRARLAEDLPFYGVFFHNAWGVWMRDTGVRDAGFHTAYFTVTKHAEVRDCRFEDRRFPGGGATSYAGFDRTWDGLMENVETHNLRHAPNLQWNASGNVIRNGRFIGSDGQWHAGWTLENLLENNIIDAHGTGGTYGHGLYASGPWSPVHGPQGPRNVVYHNDVSAPKDGLHMLGGNEAWIVVHNRFVTDRGRAVFAREKSFDHIIAGNVFMLRGGVGPAVFLGVDSVGVELRDNVFYGATPPLVGFAGGITRLARDEGNTAHAEVPATLPARPSPAVPSLFEWQRANLAAIRAAQAAAEARR